MVMIATTTSCRLMLLRPIIYVIAIITVVRNLALIPSADFWNRVNGVSFAKNYTSLQQRSAAPTKPTMLLGIFSTRNELSRRQYIRETMLNVSGNFLCPLQVYLERNDTQCQVIYAFIVGDGASDTPQKNTQATNLTQLVLPCTSEEPDVVRLNILESMDGGKSPTYFAFGALLDQELRQQSFHHHIDYIAKMDSDTLMNFPALVKFLNDYLVAFDEPRYLPTYGGMILDWMNCGGPWIEDKHCDTLKGRVYMQGESSCSVDYHMLCLSCSLYYHLNRWLLFHESTPGKTHHFPQS